jgi:type VI protein secretion system component Hcp
MTTQPENKDKAEQKVSKDELSEKELEKATGGKGSVGDITITKHIDVSTPVL